jgi:hypothetical protein
MMERLNSTVLRNYLGARVSFALVAYGTSTLKSVLPEKVFVVLICSK